MRKISVVFTKGWRSYNGGDRAGFYPDKDGNIEPIEEGVATYADGSGRHEELVTREAKPEKPSGLKAELEAIDHYPTLKSRAHQVAKDHGESLSELESQDTETLIAYILEREG